MSSAAFASATSIASAASAAAASSVSSSAASAPPVVPRVPPDNPREGVGPSVGAPVPMTINGEELLYDPTTVDDLGTIGNHLESLRPNLLKEAGLAAASMIADNPGNPAVAQAAQMLMDRAMIRAQQAPKVSLPEIAEWVETLPGFSFCLWLKLSQRYPEKGFTVAGMAKLIETMDQGERLELMHKKNIADGSLHPPKKDGGQGEAVQVAPNAN